MPLLKIPGRPSGSWVRAGRSARSRESPAQEPEAQQHDREVHEEDALPPPVLRHETAEDRAEGEGRGGCDRRDAGARLPGGARGRRRRCSSAAGASRAAPTPCRARAAMSAPVLPASAAIIDAAANTATPTVKIGLAAVAVGEAPAEEHESGEGEDVGRDDPLQPRAGEAELSLDRRQRDVDDRVVERRDEGRERQRRDDRHGAPAGGSGAGSALMVLAGNP